MIIFKNIEIILFNYLEYTKSFDHDIFS